MAEYIYMTQEGLEKLKAELNDLKTRGRQEAAQAIAEAREKGDLSENAEYDAAKEAQGLLELKISKLEEQLGKARLLDDSKLDTSKVMVLSKVKIKNLKMNKVFDYTLVSEAEADLRAGKISVNSPIGKGLVGKKKGDVAVVEAPGGNMEFEILEVSR
jgi:transcription elongation factor GreA